MNTKFQQSDAYQISAPSRTGEMKVEPCQKVSVITMIEIVRLL